MSTSTSSTNSNSNSTAPTTSTSQPSIFQLFPPHRTPSLTLLLHHLHSTQHAHVVPYLTNLLYSLPLYQIQPYIPQLLNIYLLRGPQETALERFLLDGSVSDWMFGMVVYWESVAMSTQVALVGGALGTPGLSATSSQSSSTGTSAASTPSSPPIISNAVRMAQLAAAVERAMLSRSIPVSLGSSSSSQKALSEKFISRRNCSFHDQIYFVDFLTNLTRRLLNYPLGPMRSARLRLELRNFENSGAMPRDIFWPLGSSRDYYERVVNVCVDECFALSTKERVPCLVFLEVIRNVDATNAEPPQTRESNARNSGVHHQLEKATGGASAESPTAGRKTRSTSIKSAVIGNPAITRAKDTNSPKLQKSYSEDALITSPTSGTPTPDDDRVQFHKRSMSMGVEVSGNSTPPQQSGENLSPLMRFPSEEAHFLEMKRIREGKKKARAAELQGQTPPSESGAPLPATEVLHSDDTQNANVIPPLEHTATQTSTRLEHTPLKTPTHSLSKEYHEEKHASEGRLHSRENDTDEDNTRIEYLNPPPSTSSTDLSTPLSTTSLHHPTLLSTPPPQHIESQIHSTAPLPLTDYQHHKGSAILFDDAHSTHSDSPPPSPTSSITFSKHYDSDDEYLIVDVPDTRKALMDEVYGESWEDRRQRIREQSPYGKHAHWDLRSFIVKSNDDIRQEEFCMQLIRLFKKIWVEEKKIPVHVCDYAIFPTSSDSGLIETIRDAVSYDTLIKKFKGYTSLLDYFIAVYGDTQSTEFRQAQRNFTESMAAYSVICYLLQIKDRHNGNIMIDREGRVVHIDFGFFLGSSPGNIHFENAPYKMTRAFAEVIAGTKENPDKSDMYVYFRILVGCCFRAAVENKERIVNLVRSMIPTCFTYPCFEHVSDRNDIIRRLEERFHAHLSDGEIEAFLSKLIDDAYCAQRTKAYDWFQYQTNGLLYEV